MATLSDTLAAADAVSVASAVTMQSFFALGACKTALTGDSTAGTTTAVLLEVSTSILAAATVAAGAEIPDATEETCSINEAIAVPCSW